MQPFTLDQAVIAALLFLLGIFIGMFFLAGGKWRRRYRDETTRVRALEAENELLRREAREMDSRRHAAATAPAPVADTHADQRTAVGDRRVATDRRGPRDDGSADLGGRKI